MLRENLIYFEFLTKLFSLNLPGLGDLDHDARMDLIDKRDASSPDPVHIRKLALDIHDVDTVGEAIFCRGLLVKKTCLVL